MVFGTEEGVRPSWDTPKTQREVQQQRHGTRIKKEEIGLLRTKRRYMSNVNGFISLTERKQVSHEMYVYD